MRTPVTPIRTLAVLALVLGAGACEDDPVGNDFGVELVEPLSIDYVGGVHKVNARANIRVDWRVEFSNLSRGCTIETRSVCDFWDDDVNQERVAFTWNPRTPPEFFAGDSIQARAITKPALKSGQAERALAIFVFGQAPAPPSVQVP